MSGTSCEIHTIANGMNFEWDQLPTNPITNVGQIAIWTNSLQSTGCKASKGGKLKKYGKAVLCTYIYRDHNYSTPACHLSSTKCYLIKHVFGLTQHQ